MPKTVVGKLNETINAVSNMPDVAFNPVGQVVGQMNQVRPARQVVLDCHHGQALDLGLPVSSLTATAREIDRP